jgi:hypothetical protein
VVDGGEVVADDVVGGRGIPGRHEVIDGIAGAARQMRVHLGGGLDDDLLELAEVGDGVVVGGRVVVVQARCFSLPSQLRSPEWISRRLFACAN